MRDNQGKFINLNFGTSFGTSVLELINFFQKINKVKIPYLFTNKREGDIARSVADKSLATSLLNWKPKRDIQDMCRDGWKWYRLNPKGYQ